MRSMQVLRTYDKDEKSAAMSDWHMYAALLRERRLAPRYRVNVVERAGSWWLVLNDHGEDQ
jgi:hypothetical protein